MTSMMIISCKQEFSLTFRVRKQMNNQRFVTNMMFEILRGRLIMSTEEKNNQWYVGKMVLEFGKLRLFK